MSSVANAAKVYVQIATTAGAGEADAITRSTDCMGWSVAQAHATPIVISANTKRRITTTSDNRSRKRWTPNTQRG